MVGFNFIGCSHSTGGGQSCTGWPHEYGRKLRFPWCLPYLRSAQRRYQSACVLRTMIRAAWLPRATTAPCPYANSFLHLPRWCATCGGIVPLLLTCSGAQITICCCPFRQTVPRASGAYLTSNVYVNSALCAPLEWKTRIFISSHNRHLPNYRTTSPSRRHRLFLPVTFCPATITCLQWAALEALSKSPI